MSDLTDLDLDNIEAAAKDVRTFVGPFAHPADTLKLVAEVRRLRSMVQAAVLAEREACARLCEEQRGPQLLPLHGALDCARAIRAKHAEKPADVCEHGVRTGDWCPPCNREQHRAEREQP